MRERLTRRVVATWVVCWVVFAAGAISTAFALTVERRLPSELAVHWWVLLVAFGFTERFVVSLDVRDQAVSINFTEAPLTIGLILSSPGDVIWTRIVVGVVAILMFRRSAFIKLVFNTGLFALQAALSVIIFYAILGDAVPVDPQGWIAALAAATASYSIRATPLVSHQHTYTYTKARARQGHPACICM